MPAAMKAGLGRLDRLLRQNSTAGKLRHFVGAGLTYADLGVFATLQLLEETAPGLLAEHGLQALADFRQHTAALPRVAEYLVRLLLQVPRCGCGRPRVSVRLNWGV